MKKKFLNDNLFIILELIFFGLLIYIVILSNSTKSISSINNFIILSKKYIIMLLFIDYGAISYISNKNGNSNDTIIDLFLNYFILYIIYFFFCGSILKNIAMIPIELFALQPFFGKAQDNFLFSSMWIINYFMFIQITFYFILKIIDKYKIDIGNIKKYFFLLSIMFALYLLLSNNEYNIVFYFILFTIGYLSIDLLNPFLRFKDNRKMAFIYKLTIPLYSATFFLLLKDRYIINFVSRIGHVRTIVLFMLLIVISLVLYFIIKVLKIIIKKTNVNSKYIIFIAIISCIVSSLVILTISDESDSLYKPFVTILNRDEMIDLKEGYYINGETSGGSIAIYINEKYVDMIIPNKIFKFKITDVMLNEGWNYIEFKLLDNATHKYSIASGAINKIIGQPSVYMNKKTIVSARKSNQKYKQETTGKYDDYAYYKEYLGSGLVTETNTRKFDKNGVPMVKNGDKYYYNPVLISSHALGLYEVYLNDNSSSNLKKFLNVADWFLKNQKSNGGFSYDINFTLHGTDEMPSGWYSGMAQGRILSVLSRAYYITKNDKYLVSGKKTLDFMIKSYDKVTRDGCSVNLDDLVKANSFFEKYRDYTIYEEYLTNPSSYVLNGDLFALLGLYDWSEAASEEYGGSDAKIAFEKGIKTIELLLPYYDYYGWSSYDLVQYTNRDFLTPYFGTSYAHACHISLLYVLGNLTNNERLLEYYNIFKNYNDDVFYSQANIIYK